MDHYRLKSVIMHITDACTGHCPYCYACANAKEYAHADINTLKAIVDRVAESSVKRISLLGGDPALFPYLPELARYIKSKNINVGIMSNTMNVSESFDEFTKYVDTYETTIHGSNAAEHDAFSGAPGAYDFLMDKLRLLSKYDVTIGIAINIIPNTVKKLFDIVCALVKEQNIRTDYVILQRIVPFGRAEGSSRYELSLGEVNEAMAEVNRIDKELGIKILVEDPFPLCAIEPQYRKYMSPCEWGYTKAALNGKGDLTRCGADPRYLLGNIFNSSLDEIWETSPYLLEFREKNHLPNSCKNCPMFTKCGGGCSLSDIPGEDLGIDYLIKKLHNIK